MVKNNHKLNEIDNLVHKIKKEMFEFMIEKRNESLTEISNLIFIANEKNGWHDNPRPLLEAMTLTAGEVFEGIEAMRTGKYAVNDDVLFAMDIKDDTEFQTFFKSKIKDSVQDEIADTFIRLFDLWTEFDFGNLESHIMAKVRYNSMRGHKHGKKF